MRWNTFANILANLAMPLSMGRALRPRPRRARSGTPRWVYFDILEERRLFSGVSPVVSDFSEIVEENGVFTFHLSDFLAHYTDQDSDPLAAVQITALPTNGVLSVTVNGTTSAVTTNEFIDPGDVDTLTYQPFNDYVGPDGMDWNASDGTQVAISAAHITLTVQAPSITGFNETLFANDTFTFSTSDFANAYTGTNPIASITILAVPPGSLTLSGAQVTVGQIIPADQLGNLAYTPTTNFTGAAAFTWSASDGTASTNSAAVSLNVNADLTNISKEIVANQTITFDPTDASGAYTGPGSAESVTLTTLPTKGTLSLSGVPITASQMIDVSQLANLTYNPNSTFTGADAFTWTVSNGTISSSIGQVNVTVDADLAGISKTLISNATANFSASDFSNAYTGPGTAQTVTIATLPAHGKLQVTINSTTSFVTLNEVIALADANTLTFSPTTDFVGSDAFTFSVSNGTISSNLATATLTVNSPFTAFSKSIDQGSTAAFTQSDFSNAFAETLVSIKILRVPTIGSLTLSGAKVTAGEVIPLAQLGNLLFKPPASFTGSDSILWTASADGTHFAAPPSTIALTVSALSVSSFSESVGENTPFDFTTAAFNSNFTGGGAMQTVRIASLPAHGTLTLTNGTTSAAIRANDTFSSAQLANLVYTPAANYAGGDTFKWTAADGGAFAGTLANVNLSVSAFTVVATSYDTTGTPIVDGDASPTFDKLTDFGGTALQSASGPALTRTYVITNITNQTISFTDLVNNIHVTDAQHAGTTSDFTVTAAPSVTTLSPNETTSFTITFAATRTGLEGATVAIPNDVSSGSQFTFKIQGTGLITNPVPSAGTTGTLLSATTVAGTGTGAFNGEILHMSYSGRLLDGSIFDQTSNHGNIPLTFRLDNSPNASFATNSTTNPFIAPSQVMQTIVTVITGWEDGIQGMQVGEHRTLIIPSDFGYGVTGSDPNSAHPNVPPNAELIFDIVLNAIDGSPSLGITNFNTQNAILPGDKTPNVNDGTDFGTLTLGQTGLTNNFLGTNNSPTTSTGAPLGQIHQTGPIKIVGANPNDFTVSGSLFNGFSITFKPLAPGVRTATFTVATDDPQHKDFTFALRGDSVAFTDLFLSGVGTGNFPINTNSNGDFTTTIPLVIQNVGNQAVPGSTPVTDIKITLQNTADTTSAPIVVGTISSLNVGGLAVSGKRTVNVPVTIPGHLTLSTYSLTATVDAGGGIVQSMTSNDFITINQDVTGTLISSSIPKLFVDTNAVKGNVVVEVKNNGTLPFATNEKVRINIQAVNGTNSAITIATGSTYSVASLKAGATKDFTVPVDFAAGITDGSYTLQAVLTLLPDGYESNNSNNTVATDASGNHFTVVSAPPAVDLTASIPASRIHVFGGANSISSSIPVIITNAGNIAVPHNASSSTDVTLFVLNTDTQVETEIGHVMHNFAGLGPTKSTSPISVPVHIPLFLPDGNYVYEVKVNTSATLPESNLSNNSATSSINISGSLVSSTLPTSVSHTAKPTKGLVTVQLTNSGMMQAPAGMVVVVNIVAHNVNSGVDTVLDRGARTITTNRWHKVNGSFSFPFAVKLPSEMPAGNYIIEAELILRPAVLESNIADDLVSTTIFSSNINLTIT